LKKLKSPKTTSIAKDPIAPLGKELAPIESKALTVLPDGKKSQLAGRVGTKVEAWVPEGERISKSNDPISVNDPPGSNYTFVADLLV
jgi:hypothetical protein